MRNHLEKVLWSDGFYIESHEGNESQKGSMNTGIHGLRPLQNLTPFSIILVFEHYWLTRSQYF